MTKQCFFQTCFPCTILSHKHQSCSIHRPHSWCTRSLIGSDCIRASCRDLFRSIICKFFAKLQHFFFFTSADLYIYNTILMQVLTKMSFSDTQIYIRILLYTFFHSLNTVYTSFFIPDQGECPSCQITLWRLTFKPFTFKKTSIVKPLKINLISDWIVNRYRKLISNLNDICIIISLNDISSAFIETFWQIYIGLTSGYDVSINFDLDIKCLPGKIVKTFKRTFKDA